MEDGDFDFEEMMAKIMMDVERKKVRRDAVQQAVERVVGRVGWFNGDDVPKILVAYNAEMTERGVDEAMRLDFFCRVANVSMQNEVKKLREAHKSWESFEGALVEMYGYKKPKGQSQQEFDRWVASIKPRRSVTEAFREFERRFAQLSERG